MRILYRAPVELQPRLLALLIKASRLTENDLNDFSMNPLVFSEWAYDMSSQINDNPRPFAYHFVKDNEELGEILFARPPRESSMFLLTAVKRDALRSHSLDCLDLEWKPHGLSTLLFTCSKAGIEGFHELLIPFAIRFMQSESPVVVTNADRLIRKFLSRRVQLDAESIRILWEHADQSLTKDAAECLTLIISQNPQIGFRALLKKLCESLIFRRLAFTSTVWRCFCLRMLDEFLM